MHSMSMRLAIHALTIFASAALLFAVQPMAGKALLPLLGGVPGAWTACLLFFQSALLAGYAYVWLGSRLMAPRARVAVHLALIAVPIVLLSPFASPAGPNGISPAGSPALFALGFLALNVGASFTLLSATGPLLQDWLAHATRERPYFLYAASNAGSLGALVAYPFLIEPWLDLGQQESAFRVAYVVVAIGVAAAGVFVLRAGGSRAMETAPSAERLTWKRRALWVGLAFVPAMLLAGSTSTLSLDLAPVPLLWVVPLAVYLATFVLAFSERVPSPPPIVGRAACLVAVVLVFATVTHANEPVWLLASLHVAFLGAGSWIAHRRLAEDAPEPRHVPEFYAWIALGGVLGTLVSAVLAPLVLNDLLEYPAAIALACATRELSGVVREDRALKTDLPHVAVVALLMLGTGWLAPRLGLDDSLVALVAFGPAAVYAYRWMPLRRRYTLCLLAIVLCASFSQERGERRLTMRSFFGVLRVVDVPAQNERMLLHGTTLHGSQRLDERDECHPLSYYRADSPLGWAFEAHRARGRAGRTVAVGLGTGSLACYAQPGEPWRFFEINPDVVEIAENPRWFTYLRETPGDVEVTLADGRLGLEEEVDGSLSVLVLDAFNSDSVPVHLLTRQALRLYLDKLEPGGWALLHLSNRVLDLPGVLADVLAAEGAAGRLAESEHATWAVVARRPEDLAALDARFAPLPEGNPSRAWTDSFSSVFSALAR